MLKSLLIEFRRRAGSYISPSITILMSLLVCFFLFNLSRPVAIECTQKKIELNDERCVMAVVSFLPAFSDLVDNDILLKELIEDIEALKGVESSTYSFSDLIDLENMYATGSDYKGFNIMRVASNFLNFFDVELLKGSGFSEEYTTGEVIITETTANSMSVGGVSTGEKIKLHLNGEDVDRDLVAVIKGDLNTYSNLRDVPTRDTPTLFESVELNDRLIHHFGAINLLFKIEESYDPLELSVIIEDVIEESRYKGLLYSKATLPLERHRGVYRLNTLTEFKVVLIPFALFIIYILISLFSSMVSIMGSRTHDIGVRRALGHTKFQVMLFIIFEPLFIFGFNSVLAISIIWSIKDTVGIAKLEEIIIYSVGVIFTIVILSFIHPLIQLLNRNHIDVIKSE